MRGIRYPWGPFSSVEAGSTTLNPLGPSGLHGEWQRGPRTAPPVRAMMRERLMVRWGAERSWLIRVMRLIRCTIGPQINHIARINHVKVKGVVQVSGPGRTGPQKTWHAASRRFVTYCDRTLTEDSLAVSGGRRRPNRRLRAAAA